MKNPAYVALIAALLLSASAPAALAGGKINRACLNSQRDNVSHQLCRCIQKAADQVLSRHDQKLAAQFFADPQMAQDVRQSSNPSQEAFWLRYKNFGKVAKGYCN